MLEGVDVTINLKDVMTPSIGGSVKFVANLIL